MSDTSKIYEKLKTLLQTKHKIVDDNVDDIRAERFAFETMPAETCAIFRMGVKMTPDLQERLTWNESKPETAEAVKVGDRVFYSTFDHTDSRLDEGYRPGFNEYYSPRITGKVITSDNSFYMCPDEYLTERDCLRSYYGVAHCKYVTKNYRGQDEEYGWWLNQNCKAKNFHDYACEQAQKDGSPVEVFRQFNRPMEKIESIADDYSYMLPHCQIDGNFKWGYSSVPWKEFIGESAYMATLPIQKFDDESLLFTAYCMHKISDKNERIIRFLHRDDMGGREEFIITRAEENGRYTSSVKVNGRVLEDLPEFKDMDSLRQVVDGRLDAGRLAKFLDEYVLGDNQKRLLNKIEQLDAYRFGGSNGFVLINEGTEKFKWVRDRSKRRWILVNEAEDKPKEEQAQKGDVLRVCVKAAAKQLNVTKKHKSVNKTLDRGCRE